MALGEYPTLKEINTELGTTEQSLSTCIANAGKTGVWDRQSDFAFYGPPLIKYAEDFTDSKRHIDYSNTSWTNARENQYGNVNPPSAMQTGLYNSYYIIVRAYFRFNFAGDVSGTITAAKLILPVNQSAGDIYDAGYIRRSGIQTVLSDGDYALTGLLSGLGTIVGTGSNKTLEIPFDSAGIYQLQKDLDAGGSRVFCVRHKKDEEDIPPTTNEPSSDFEYPQCRIELSY